MGDGKAPHRAVVLIQIEVHELLDSGECGGNPVTAQELKDHYGLNTKNMFYVDGSDKFDCIKKLNEKLEVFRK